MGFEEGRIIFNSDTGIYYSGQTVYGKLIFDQEKEKKFRGIYVKLKGFCNVHWRTSRTRTVNGKTETYYEDHTSREEYVNQKTYVIGSESGETTISPGHYEYPFQLAIPANCPSSFEGSVGHVRYEIKAVVDRAFKIDQEKKAVVRVIEALDLNSEPGAKDPVSINFDETYYCCCSRSGSVSAVVKVPYRGYVPGQTIPIEVSCENNGSVTIDTITFTLKKDIKFHAQGTRSESQDVAQLEMGEVQAGTTRRWTAELAVPYVDTPCLRHCRYIDLEHRLKVVLSPDGCHSNSSQSRDLVIGTIPIAGSNFTPNAENPMASQNAPVVNQPLASPYPGANTPHPTVSPYPSNTQYPGSTVTPYPTNNSPYPNRNEHPPYPPPYTETPYSDAPYPVGPTPYPISNTSSEKPPYPGDYTMTPGHAMNSPYPTSNSPYPTSNAPYPTSNAPYPASNAPYPASITPYPTSNVPYPTSNTPYPPTSSPYPASLTATPFNPAPTTTPQSVSTPASTGLRTGTFGFLQQPNDKASMPQLPPGATPYPPTSNPYATATAPQLGPPDNEKK